MMYASNLQMKKKINRCKQIKDAFHIFRNIEVIKIFYEITFFGIIT